MRILFLTQIIPYPPNAGPRVKTYHVLRYLAERGHRVVLASFVRSEEYQYLSALQPICEEIHPILMRRSRLRDIAYMVRSQITGRPFLIERDDLASMRNLVQQLVSTGSIDIIHADQLTMTQFAFAGNHFAHRVRPSMHPQNKLVLAGSNGRHAQDRQPFLVFDAHNAVWTIVDRMRQNMPWFLKPVLSLEARRVKRYEGALLCNYDHTLAVTEQDRQALLEAVSFQENGGGSRRMFPGQHANPAVTVIPIGIDTEQLSPITREARSTNLITLGTLHYPPNADGIRWFTREVFPLIREQIPEATLTIVGKNPPPDFQQLAAQSGQAISVTGYVPDLIPYLEKAALMVVPVRAGGGMRVRILEAFSRAIPVVTTTIGLEGIEAQAGRDVLVADTPLEFALATLRLLQHPDLQTRLAQNSRQLVEKLYDWRAALTKLDSVYEAIVANEHHQSYEKKGQHE